MRTRDFEAWLGLFGIAIAAIAAYYAYRQSTVADEQKEIARATLSPLFSIQRTSAVGKPLELLVVNDGGPAKNITVTTTNSVQLSFNDAYQKWYQHDIAALPQWEIDTSSQDKRIVAKLKALEGLFDATEELEKFAKANIRATYSVNATFSSIVEIWYEDYTGQSKREYFRVSSTRSGVSIGSYDMAKRNPEQGLEGHKFWQGAMFSVPLNERLKEQIRSVSKDDSIRADRFKTL